MTFLYMGLNSSTWGVIKSHKNKERERKEEKPKQKRKSGPISLSDRMGLLPGGGRLFQHIPCAHRFSGEIQLLLQQPWCRRTRMDDRSDYAVMHNNWIAAGRTSCVNMQSWFDWIQWKEHLNPGRQHFFFWFVSMAPKTLFKCFSFSENILLLPRKSESSSGLQG